MDSLNVKNINDEKIFNVIDPNGQGEVVNRIRPISISINQKAETINDQTDSTINLAVYWNDTWKSILDLTFDESLRQEYGKLVEDLTTIQKDIDMKQYKDAETKTDDFLKYVANLSSKYTAIPEKAVVSKIKNDFVKIKADKNSVKVAISDKLLNFMLKKYAKVDNLDYTKSNECFSTSKFNCLANNYDFYYHSPEIFQKQAYMTVVKDNKVIGSYKVDYDQFSKFASKFMLTPQKLGYSRDRLAGYMKTAEVVMQNIFFDSVDEAKEWQEMVDEKKKEQVETSNGEEETTEIKETETKTKTEIGEGKSESPVKEDGGLARPSEDFASDEIPESEPRQQDQQGGGQNLGASKRVKNVKKTAKVGYNAEPENELEEKAVEIGDEIMNVDWNFGYKIQGVRDILWQQPEKKQEIEEKIAAIDKKRKEAIEKVVEKYRKEFANEEIAKLVDEHLEDNNFHTASSIVSEFVDNEILASKINVDNDVKVEAEFDCIKDETQKLNNLNRKDKDFKELLMSLDKGVFSLDEYEKKIDSMTEEDRKAYFDWFYTRNNYVIHETELRDFLSNLARKYNVVAASKKVELNKQARTVNSKQDIKQILKDKNAVETRNYGDFVNAIRENKTPIETVKAYGKKKTAGGYDEYVLVVYEGGAYFYTELSANGKRVDEKYYKFENVEKQAKEYKRYNVIVKFNDKEEEYEFENDNEFLALDEALGYFGEKWHELPLANEIEKLEEVKVQELDVDDKVLNEYTKEYFIKNKDKFPKYSCKKQAIYGDVQEQDIVPAKTETKVYLQSDINKVINIPIKIADVVTIYPDNIATEEEVAKYSEFIGKPMLLMETDKEDVNKVILEELEYPFQRITVDGNLVGLYDTIKSADVIVEDEDGDEMITTFEELPVVAKQCKIKSIHKAANKKKANLTKKAINSLEEVAGLIDTIWSDYDWYEYADALEVGEKSHYEDILADVQKDEKSAIEGILKLIAEDDNGYTSPEVEQLKEYYNNKFGNGGK